MTEQRKPTSRRLRFEILRRDNYTCRYCGASAPDATLTVDHVIPVALGGGDEPNNLITACKDCNAGKSSISADAALVQDVDATALLFAEAMKKATRIRIEEIRADRKQISLFDEMWREFSVEVDGQRVPIERSPNWEQTIIGYLASGLSMFDLATNIDIAMKSSAPGYRVWRYFCGVCRNELIRRQELARSLIEDGEV